MSMPKADPGVRDFFLSLLPQGGQVVVRPMFGQTAGFVNGNMFSGTFGAQVFVRLPEPDRAELLAVPGASVFTPMEGRPMSEYVVMPESWRDAPEEAEAWVARSLAWAAGLPPKEPKPKKPSREAGRK
jgi:TfoX/Sxy family transcriptional regulator of competence genes